MAVAAIRFRSVAFAYESAPVFSRLDLEVAEGEMVAVLGPNGTGKTTLIRLASGHLRPAAGEVAILGRHAASIPARERARLVAVVPQESRPAFDLTAAEVVRMGRTPHLGLLGIEGPRDEAMVRSAMEQADVGALAGRSFLSLSGGERQRVVLARAVAQEPRMLLLDEPTAFLDLKHRLAVYDLLVRLNRDAGLTLVLASHDLDLAARYCSRLVLLHQGEVAADGPPERVLSPRNLRIVYDVDSEVRIDPTTHRPVVVPLGPRSTP